MSLVAYGSSDESSDDEGNSCDVENENKNTSGDTDHRTTDKLCLPAPKHDTLERKVTNEIIETNIDIPKEKDSLEKIHFDKLPKPKSSVAEVKDIEEEDDIPPKKEIELKPEKPVKKDRAPVRITVPSLSEFKDVEEESVAKTNRIKPSCKGTKLFALLPPPKSTDVKSTKSLIPTTVNKAAAKNSQTKTVVNKVVHTKDLDARGAAKPAAIKGSLGISYDSNSEDEEDVTTNSASNPSTDFFALTATEIDSKLPDSVVETMNVDTIAAELKENFTKDNNSQNHSIHSSDTSETETSNSSQKMLVSNVMNLPREEILLKNKAEVGPKLPVPEQEYNVDVEGNVAFDEKAIEYLCGRRGVKRKNKEVDEANIIEINGEDIKPDEREWLVKALTEEPVQRPISMQGGVNSQSKKKHQITYLAHQAKAMEMELKNQWAQNRLTRKQTQSKYGF